MEFSFSIHPFLKDEITVFDRDHDLLKCTFSRSFSRENSHRDELREIINKLGANSAKAQGLHGSITSVEQLRTSEQRCYILKDTDNSRINGLVIGFLKVGSKRLFFINQESQTVEVTPLCVLDFYVHESSQRKGHGLKLFNFMMEKEGVSPAAMAIDRPSDKMLGFYRKKFHLSAPLKQPNNFVVFRDFFKFYVSHSSKRWTDQQRRGPIKLRGVTNTNKTTEKTGDPPSSVQQEQPVPEKPPSQQPSSQQLPSIQQPLPRGQQPPPSVTHPPPPTCEKTSASTTTTAAPDIRLPSVFDRPLSGFVRSNSGHTASNSHGSNSTGSHSNGSHSYGSSNSRGLYPNGSVSSHNLPSNSYTQNRNVKSSIPHVRKDPVPPSHSQPPFSWSRNAVAVNYVVGGVKNHVVNARQTHFNRPRPF